jgi:archaellum component FlaG (FlaF/FlaG flagellin family)
MNIERSGKMENKKSGLATAGLVLGIIGICLSFIPIINNAAFFLGVLAIIFGIIPLIKKKSKGKAISALVLGILSIIITLSLQSSWAASLDEISNDLDTMTGDNTEEVLKNLDINYGTFEIVTDEYGFTETKLTVTITNKTNERKSFNLDIEAVTTEGSRIEIDYIYATDLAAGQSQSFDIFEYIEDDKLEIMKSATFNIVEASMY